MTGPAEAVGGRKRLVREGGEVEGRGWRVDEALGAGGGGLEGLCGKDGGK